jgi:hypothetical protein
LASLFVLVTLISLIFADPVPGGVSGAFFNSPATASELHLRYALRR